LVSLPHRVLRFVETVVAKSATMLVETGAPPVSAHPAPRRLLRDEKPNVSSAIARAFQNLFRDGPAKPVFFGISRNYEIFHRISSPPMTSVVRIALFIDSDVTSFTPI
jgi:hypothetical protein